jgi:hypothetical protein
MAERGRSLTHQTSASSNQVVKSGYGTLYSIHYEIAQGGTIQVVDSADLGTTPNINAAQTGLVWRIASVAAATRDVVRFVRGAGIDAGLALAVTSNTNITLEYE